MSRRTEAFNLLAIMERFPDEESAREYLESVRWPEGAVCPHCACTEAYRLQARPDSKRPGRKGLYKCKACRKQFTVTVKTIFEDSRRPAEDAKAEEEDGAGWLQPRVMVDRLLHQPQHGPLWKTGSRLRVGANV